MSPRKIFITIFLFLFSLFTSWVLYVIDFDYRIPLGLLVILLIIAASKILEVSPKKMGIESATLKQGVFTAVPFMLVIVGVVAAAYLIRPETFLDARYNQSLGAMLYSVFIVIPLATVLLEELFFRGLYFGYLLDATSKTKAFIICSFAFGLWHFFTSKSVSIEGVFISPVLISVAVVVATSLAGALFLWLRIRGKNLITPMLVHWTINATGVIASYVAWQ